MSKLLIQAFTVLNL